MLILVDVDVDVDTTEMIARTTPTITTRIIIYIMISL